MKKTWLVFLILTAGAASGFGESVGDNNGKESEAGKWVYRGEIFGSLGWGALYHGNHHEFSGLNTAAAIGVRPFDDTLSGLGFEARFAYLNSNEETNSNVLIFSGCAVYHFGKSKIQPYVLGGFGVLRGERTVIIKYGSGTEILYEERYQDALNKIGFEFGGGVKIALTPHLALRPEFRLLDTTPGAGYNLGVPQVNCGLGYHW